MEPPKATVATVSIVWSYPGTMDPAKEYTYIDLNGVHTLQIDVAKAELSAIQSLVTLLNSLQVEMSP